MIDPVSVYQRVHRAAQLKDNIQALPAPSLFMFMCAGPKAAGQGVVEGLAKEDPERYGSGRSSPA
jgi:hypothetical protein